MLTIHRPEIIEREKETILQATFECGGQQHTLWFSTPNEFGRYLCHERGDAFVVALLLYAMKRGEDIEVLAPVSARLHYTLTKHYIKVLADTDPRLRSVRIICDLEKQGLKDNAGAVGTGFSAGVDSFYTVIDHFYGVVPSDYRLTHLAFFNVGGNGDMGGERARKLFHQRIGLLQPCANELGLPLVTVDSNINELLAMNYKATHTIRTVSAVLALQKLFKTYYSSAGHTLSDFKVDPDDAGYSEPYTLSMLSTEDVALVPTGETYTRVEKTSIIADHPISYTHLNVCASTAKNCSQCPKCIRTMVTLDVLGKLQLYKDVFDLDDYRQHRFWYLGQVVNTRNTNPYNSEIFRAISEREYPLPRSLRLFRHPQAAHNLVMRAVRETMRVRNGTIQESRIKLEDPLDKSLADEP